MATYYNPKIVTNNIEFSVDAANPKSWNGGIPGGPAYGYMAAGRPTPVQTTVDRIDYSSDTPAMSPKGPLSAGRYNYGAIANSSYGYWAGGAYPNVSIVDRLDFSSDTTTCAVKGPLATVRYGLRGVGNASYGYFACMDAALSIVYRLDYASDTSTPVEKGPLSYGRHSGGATGNDSYGYIVGGYPHYTTIDRIDYSNDTATASPTGTLTSATQNCSATGNSSYGYVGGGESPGPANSTVQRLDYSSDTSTAPVKGPLTDARGYIGATGSNSYGYFSGGTPGTVSTTDRIDYSNDTPTTSTKGPLSSARFALGGLSPRANGLPKPESIWKDITGKGHDMDILSATNQPTFSPLNGGVWDFDGSGDYISYTDQSPYPLRNWWDKAWTVEYWMKADAFGQSANGGSYVVGVTSLSTTGEVWSFGPEENGEVQWYYYNGSAQTVASGKTLSTGQWYHLVFAFDGSTGMTIFVNGVLEKSATVSGSPSGTSATFSIGKITSGGSSSTFNGKVALVRIYKAKGFTASEVLNNFNATRTRFGV